MNYKSTTTLPTNNTSLFDTKIMKARPASYLGKKMEKSD